MLDNNRLSNKDVGRILIRLAKFKSDCYQIKNNYFRNLH